jgi:hypothetical protein
LTVFRFGSFQSVQEIPDVPLSNAASKPEITPVFSVNDVASTVSVWRPHSAGYTRIAELDSSGAAVESAERCVRGE